MLSGGDMLGDASSTIQQASHLIEHMVESCIILYAGYSKRISWMHTHTHTHALSAFRLVCEKSIIP